MEEILNLYQQPYDPLYPVICVDERPCQLIGDLVMPLPMKQATPLREDYHYKRNGTVNLFIAFEPHTGQRIVEVTENRTQKAYARFLLKVANRYASAEKIIVVQDNLNTHTPAAFYVTFSAQQAFDLAQRFLMHYTPTNGSWLNMVEIEISAISRECLNRRIASKETLAREVEACVKKRNAKRIKVDWQFSVNKARDKFQRFYPNPS